MGVPQLPQREPGGTIDRPAGMRAMQTLKKLPHTAPNTAASAVANGDDTRAAISSMCRDYLKASGTPRVAGAADAKVTPALKRIWPLGFALMTVVGVGGCKRDRNQG